MDSQSQANYHDNTSPTQYSMPSSQPVSPTPAQFASGSNAGAGAGQTYSASAQQPIYVQVPPQKSSKAPWIILIVVLCLVILLPCVGLYACSAGMSSLFSSSAATTAVTKAGTSFTNGNTIAVIHLDEQIAGSGAGSMTPESFRICLNDAIDDSNVKAILLRIDSPGGTAAASQEIALMLQECTKPVVVSTADICASGAYMVASQADSIVALPASSVGSIGVILTLYNYEELLDKLGIEVDSITSAEEKDAGSGYRALTEEEHARLQAQVDEINNMFIDIVAEGRGLSRTAVEEVATGETFTGQKALELGLIDELGTYDDALEKAARLAGIENNYTTKSFDSSSIEFDIMSLFGY